jgi:two-component system OmpR family sensor kinase
VRLSSRVSAFFLAALAVVLAGFSAGIFATSSRYLRHQVDERLASALAVLVAAVEIHTDSVEWEPQEREVLLGQADGPNRLRWTVHDDRGHRLGHSQNLDASSLTPAWTPDPDDLKPPRQLEDRDGLLWRIARRRVEPNAALVLAQKAEPGDSGTLHKALLLTVAAPLAPVDRTLTSLGWLLAGLALGVWIVAAVLGRWLVGRALAPLSRMVESARGLDAADAGWSLPTTATGDELDELGRAFNELLERLHLAYERQRRFASDASHQLRTPLTALIGELEVARRRERSPEEYRHVLDDAHAEAVHLREIIESLLFLARAETDAPCPNLRPIDLATWLPAHLRNWSDHNRGCDVRSEFPPPPVLVLAHAPLLGQLLDNLLENACKYSAPGTPIRVAVRREPGAALLIVEDHGVGLAPEELAHIFEPFYRTPSAHLRGQPGVGLGLAVVQRIVANFCATIHAESEPGQGTRFVVRFSEARLQ